jgi:thiamine biosynthesis lipoprotein
VNSVATHLPPVELTRPPQGISLGGMGQILSAGDVAARIGKTVHTTVERGMTRLTFNAMGTQCKVQFHGVTTSVAREFQNQVVAWVAQFEARYSRFIPDSLIGRINAGAGEHWVEIDPDTERLFGLCQELFFFTRGSFDPTALPLIRLWNWKAQPPVVPTADAIHAARELVGWNKVQRRPGAVFLPRAGMSIDLGGIGKEYAVDCVMNQAGERGIQNVLVDFGQDVRVRGHALDKEFWWIGLEDATHPGKCWAGVAVTDHAVATSGDYVRCFDVNGRRYSHIIDPRTGYPADSGCHAASVISPSCTIAGLLSTSAIILGAEEGLRLIEMHPGAAGAITTHNNKVYSRKFHEYIPAK